jgi:AraC-like DNA-binding protein
MPGVEVRRASLSGSVAPHFHENFAIALLTSGQQRMRTGRAETYVPHGAIQLHAPFVAHSNSMIDATGFGFVQLEVSPSASDALPDGGARRFHDFFGQPMVRDAAFFADLARAFEHVMFGDSLSFEFELSRALRRLAPTLIVNDAHDAPRSVVDAVRDFLHAHASETIRADALTALCGYSRTHLARVFAARFGLPPHAYLLQLRIARAKTLLASGMRVADAAVEAGFADQSQLHRHFARFVQITLGAYVRAQRTDRQDGA